MLRGTENATSGLKNPSESVRAVIDDAAAYGVFFT